MKKTLLILTFFSIWITSSFGQIQKATTESGKKVILNSNGTWEYEKEKEDSTSVEQSTENCNIYIETITDKVTGEASTSAKSTLIVSRDGGKKGFGIFLMKGSKSTKLIFVISAAGAGSCIDKGDKINILFTDGTRLELYSDGKFNCKGQATLYFGGVFGKNSELEMLKNKKIETLRVWTNNGYVEENFTIGNQNEFQHTVSCLLE